MNANRRLVELGLTLCIILGNPLLRYKGFQYPAKYVWYPRKSVHTISRNLFDLKDITMEAIEKVSDKSLLQEPQQYINISLHEVLSQLRQGEH